MAVYGSPFSSNFPKAPKKGTAPQPPTGGTGLSIDKLGTGKGGVTRFTAPMGTAGGVNYGGSVDVGGKSSLYEEKANLNKALRTISSRIATGQGNTEELLKEARRIATEGGRADTSRGVWGFIKNEVGDFLEPVAKVLNKEIPFSGGATLGGTLSQASRYIQSAGMFIAEPAGNITEFAFGGTDWKDLDWTTPQEAWSRANDENWGIFKDPKYMTGNKWIDGAGQFVTDVATDPLTYVTLGASGFAGAVGRRALRDKFATTTMRNLYPELAGKLDDIERYGIWAIPKNVRDAEGLQAGIKFAGKVIPLTDTAGEVLASPFVKARTSIGDSVYKVAPKALEFVTPKSSRAAVAAGLGRNLGIEDDEVVRIAAAHSAAGYLKGTRNTAYKDSTFEVKDLIGRIEKSNAEQQVRRAVESPAFYDAAPREVQELADEFKAWQNKLRTGANDVYRKFGIDYGADVREIAFVDDYIHHKITNEARNWIFSPRNVTSRKWNPSDLSVEELTSAVGAARYRKARVGGEFMGVTNLTPEQATIDGLNKIAFEQTGVKEWFDTSLSAIADSYAYSMASAKGREAWARRVMDFGSEAMTTIAKKAVPDEDLVRDLTKTHQKLLRGEKILKAKVSTGVAQVQRGTSKFADRAQQLARQVLDGNVKQQALTDREIATVQGLLAQIDVELQQVRDTAATKTAQQRGDFTVVHKELVHLRQRLSTALEKGDAMELVVGEELKRIYAVLYPKARNIPDDVNVLAERILQKQGIPAAREVREAQARLTSLREQLDDLPSTRDYDDVRQGLIDAQLKLEEDLAGFEQLADVRMNASYAPDGLLYGVEDALVPLPDGVAPYKVLDTVPDRAGIDNPQYIAVQAFDEKTLIDLRRETDFRELFGEEMLPDYVRVAIENAGLDSQTFYDEFVHFKQTGEIDPMFVELYPEETQLIQTLDFLNGMPIPDEGLTHGTLESVFNALNESFRGVASRYSYEESDEIARQVVDDILGAHLQNDPRSGIIAPRAIADGIYDSDDEVFAVLLDPKYGDTLPPVGGRIDPRDTVQRASESTFVRSIVNADYETASLNASMEMKAAADQIMEAELGLSSRQTLEARARSERARIGGMSRAAQKRVTDTQGLMNAYRKTGKIRTTIDGKRVTITKDKAQQMLAKADAKYSRAEKRMLDEIARIDAKAEAQTQRLLKKQMDYNDRLGMLMDQQLGLRNWNDEAGVLLQNEVDNLNEILRMRPPRGAGAEQTRIWQRRVQQSVESMKVLPENERRIYEALTKIVHADEAKLAWLSTEAIPDSAMQLSKAKTGELGGQMVDDILDGWEAIEALGVQVPAELLDTWRPNLLQLRNLAERGNFAKGYDWYMRFFKTYAMMSTGFVVRNAMSATVNNYIAGTTTKNIIRGAKAMMAIESKGANWLDEFPEAERALLEQARKVAAASSGGQVDELAEPVIGKTWAERAINNKVTNWFGKLNEKAETAVRIPLALESLEQGMTFDQALARVKRYHFDYSDLSTLDEKAKKWVPFWIWATRNIPLQVANQWSRPAVYNAHQKLKESVPVDANILLPRWMEEMNALGIGGSWVLTPDLPFNRLSSQIGQFANPSRLVGQITPIAKVPVELWLADRQLSTDIPFTEKYQEARGVDAAVAYLGDLLGLDAIGKRDKDGTLLISSKAQYAPNAIIPTLAQAQRLTGGAVGGKETYGERQLSSIANWFGVPVRNVGEQQQRGEAINRQFSLKDFAKVLEARGSIPPKS